MKILYIFGLLLISLVSLAQKSKLTDEQLNSSGANNLSFVEKLNQVDSFAKIDISKGTPFLLLQSGIAPVEYTTDSIFESKYHVFYFEYGCTGPNEMFASEYNKVIFEYLTNNYGKEWMHEIRKDVIGFKKRGGK